MLRSVNRMTEPAWRAGEVRSRMRLWMACALLALVFGITGRAGEPAQVSTNHWAFQPVREIAPPKVAHQRWARTTLDRFILAKLEANKLSPSSAADRRALIRRATFDLIGLPPTPEEVTVFVHDPATTEKAFAALVDRLLGSPHYGERWGRHWLDVARYADNKGYVFFEEKTYPWAWTYRDYVVGAFNEDKPFDQFVREQLAADQSGVADGGKALPALGFITVGDHFSNNTHDILDDRIDVVTRGLLGLTVACARCHDHKFDPLTMGDYYALYGVFRTSAEPMIPPAVAAPALTEAYEEFELVLLDKQRRLREFVEGKHREIVEGGRTRVAEYLMAVYAQRNQPATESFMLIADKGDVNPAVVSRWRGYLDRVGATNSLWAPWHSFAAPDETNFATLAPRVRDGLLAEAQLNPLVREAVMKPDAPRTMKEVAERYGRMFTAAEQGFNTATATKAEQELHRVLHGPDAPPDIPAQMDWGFLSLLPDRASQGEFQKFITDLEQWLMRGPEAPPRAMVLQDVEPPFEPRLFLRGNPNRPGAFVPRRFLTVLDPKEKPFRHGSGRRELADAITDPKNPLTARVFVNRVWLHHFGAGLVSTPSDFGLRGEPPSHPELLDWLAGEFMRSGWKVKELHRRIMNSAAYQQVSVNAAGSRGQQVDPENRLLWRMNPRRHDFETLRDALLSVSGRIDLKCGGQPVNSTLPRRTLYNFVDRLDLPPVFSTFDFPSPSASCPQRGQTTVAPQALYLMNNEFAAESAAATLRRNDVARCDSTAKKLERLCQVVLGREPREKDVRLAQEFLGANPDEKTWQQFVQALLLTNEFAFVD